MECVVCWYVLVAHKYGKSAGTRLLHTDMANLRNRTRRVIRIIE